jgi:outer membrane receptor protein involved in Fe transport
MTLTSPVLSSCRLALLACAGLLTGLVAQTAPAAKPAAPAEGETILLSPFEVRTEGDVGYTAASALAGGRTDAPLKLSSAAISVMTSQFLEDIGATNFRSAGEWALNWVPFPESNTSIAGGFSINYRNMGATFASRNYFLWYVESDSYNTERYEFARGPNGVLFGDAGAGGISTTWTKRPRFDRATNSLNTRVDSYGGYRSSIDLNRPLTKGFALRSPGGAPRRGREGHPAQPVPLRGRGRHAAAHPVSELLCRPGFLLEWDRLLQRRHRAQHQRHRRRAHQHE